MTKKEELLDTLVRDLTTVHPMPKSEVRALLDKAFDIMKAEGAVEERERILANFKDCPDCDDDFKKFAAQHINDLLK